MASSSAGFYMKDGRLFESVFFARSGTQDFELYTNEGTDIGRMFYAGAGNHETGYQRKDGTDIGRLLYDNTEPVGVYITANLAQGTEMYYESCGHYNGGGGVPRYEERDAQLAMVAHPTDGSGLYTYAWSATASSQGSAEFRNAKDKAVVPSGPTLTYGTKGEYYNDSGATGYPYLRSTTGRKQPIWWYGQNVTFTCAVTDTLSSSTASASWKVRVDSWTCSDTCADN